ncbi:MAG: hypothetical protein Q8P41_03605 [Pseudomonadota bacterium]|nr:hypothetical protein [Pseudomonadota bacterium]
MKLHRPVLTALVLLVGLPAFAPQAMAWDIQPSIGIVAGKDAGHERIGRIVFTVPDASGTAAVTAEIKSDAGDEDLPLVETDAWLHGAATITALPAADAALSLTLYDSGSASLMSFSGTLGKDGSVTLTADEGSTREKVRDIEVLSAELFAASKGYDVALDLAGADTYSVAYATITVTEPGAEVCLVADEKGNCLKWDATKAVSTRTEVYWDDIGSVWEADATLAHEGLIEVKVKTYDAEGEELETAKSELGAPWQDDGEGVNTLATDEDPLTRLALHKHYGALQHWHAMSVVSEGWSAGDSVPVDAEVELTNGETVTIPVNSYQKRGIILYTIDTWSDATGHFDSGTFRIAGPGFVLPLSPTDLYFGREAVPTCADGFCATVTVSEKGEYELSMTAYGDDASTLPEEIELSLAVLDEFGKEVATETALVEFDDEITAVFANEVSFVGDPVGLGLSGKVKLLGEADGRGKQETLAKGKFYGSLSRDGDGDLQLAGAKKGGSSGLDDLLVVGILFHAAVVNGDDNGDGVISGPPAVQYSASLSGRITVPRVTTYTLSVQNTGKLSPIY